MKRLVAGLALVMAACQPDAPAPVAETAPAATPAPPATAELFSVAAGQKILPAPLIGKWDASVAACGEASSDARLVMDATTMKFWETEGVVFALTPTGPNAMDVDGKFSGEGNHWDGRLHMELSADGKSLTIVNGTDPFTRVKCP